MLKKIIIGLDLKQGSVSFLLKGPNNIVEAVWAAVPIKTTQLSRA